jgi:osmoprotectant transport system permease protein
MIAIRGIAATITLSFGEVWRWYTTAEHWRGPGGIPHRLEEHIAMSAAAVLAALIISLPIGLLIGHTGRGVVVGVNVANIGRAIPSFAILVIGAEVLHIGAQPAFLALLALAIPPIITNTSVAIREVDADAREAAKGMGMTGGQVLRKVEIPLAVPLLMAGVRTAGVQVVATATLAAVVAWGGLGRFIIDGIAQQDGGQLVGGALLVVLLSFLTEVGLGVVQQVLTPAGIRRAAVPVATPGAATPGAGSAAPAADAGPGKIELDA